MPARLKYDAEKREILLWTSRDLDAKGQNLSSRTRDRSTKIWHLKPLLANIEELLSVFQADLEFVDPVIYQLLERERGRSILFEKIKNLQVPAELAPYDYMTRPLPHQVAGTTALLQRNRVILGDDRGTGKSKTIIDAMCSRMQQGILDRVLVVCPSSLKWNWKHEIDLREECMEPSCHDPENKNRAHHGLPGYERVMVIDGTMEERLEQFLRVREYNWIIMNYEILRIHADDIAGEFDGQAVVFDEAHRLKNPKAQVTVAAFRLAERTQFLVPATGTPLSNEAKDVWPLTHMVEPGLLGHKIWDFERRFMIKEKVTLDLFDRETLSRKPRTFSKKMGYKDLDVLRNLLDTVMIRRLREQVLDLPPKRYQKRVLELAGDQKTQYESMRKTLVAEYKYMPEKDFQLRARNAGSQLVRLQMIADGFLQAQGKTPQWFENNAKFKELDTIVEDAVNGGEKLVIFTRFLAPIHEIERRYEKHGVVSVYGDVKDTERFERVQTFQRKNDVHVFVGQVKTAGEGINLTASHLQVQLDRWWSLSVNEQAEDRQHRIGMNPNKPLDIIDLMIRGTIDTYMAKILRDRRALSAQVTGDDFRLTKGLMMTLLGEGEGSGEQPEDLEF